jgi:spore coat polysaccharide biosynthesis protein SpsF (cytidylyltransferase family)
MKEKIIAVVQARMGSSRFPGKSLETIGDWSLIELVLKRASQSKMVEQVILATSVDNKDNVLETHIKQLGFPVSRGSEGDVLDRFYKAAKPYKPTILVRITGDCPLISPVLIDRAISKFLEKKVDYLALSIGEEKELAYPRGFDVEVARFESLKQAAENATEKYEREHVMPYLYTHEALFSTFIVKPPPSLSRPRYRLCVDTQQDLEVILKIHEYFGHSMIDKTAEDIIEFLDKNPDVSALNQSVKQKDFKEVDNRIG